MKYGELIIGKWYKYLRKDGTGVYGRHKSSDPYINTVPGQKFINIKNRDGCVVTNDDYHHTIEPLTATEMGWIEFCAKTKRRATLESYAETFGTIDNYSII